MFLSQGGNREMEFDDDLFIFLFPCGFLAFRQLICYETFTSLCQMPMSRFNPAIDLSFLKFFQSNCKTQFFSTFFQVSFLQFTFVSCFLFFVSEVLILSLEVCRLILHLSMVSDIAKCRSFIMLFFLNIFCSKCSFFLNCWAQVFYMQDVKQNVWRDKKKVS